MLVGESVVPLLGGGRDLIVRQRDGEVGGTYEGSGKVDTCCARVCAIQPLRLGESEQSLAGHFCVGCAFGCGGGK